MDKVTQQNASSAEESSSAACELSSQAEELASMVGSFRIVRHGHVRDHGHGRDAAMAASRSLAGRPGLDPGTAKRPETHPPHERRIT
jgi:methyl-accepting chemotaxis protein